MTHINIRAFLACIVIFNFFVTVSAAETNSQKPAISLEKITIISTEEPSEEEQEGEQGEAVKTIVHEEVTATVYDETGISTDGVVTGQPQTYHYISYQEWEDVVYSPKRAPSERSATAENVTVYTQEDIEELPARDLTEVLTYVPSVDVQLSGQFGQATSLSINGSNARQVLLMVDGIPFNTQLSGLGNPSQIPVGHIDRIEVIKGGASSVYGSSLGGVVNVITKDVGTTEEPTGSLTQAWAEFRTSKTILDIAGEAKDVGYFLSGSFMDTNGPQAISETKEKKFFGKLSAPLDYGSKLTGSFGYNSADTRYGLSTSSTFSSQPYLTRYGQLRLDVDEIDYQWNVALKYNHQDITTDIFNVGTETSTSSTVSSNLYKGISINASIDLYDYGSLVIGSDFDWHTLKSNNFLDTGKDIAMQAPYVNYTIEWDDWEFIAGLRHDNNNRFGSQTSPSFGAVYNFDDVNETRIRAKVSRAFNAPPLLWIFNNDRIVIIPSIFEFVILPNPDLKAETADVYELGFETNLFSQVYMSLDLYHAEVEDAIAVVTLDPSFNNFTTQSQNVDKVRRRGAQMLLSYDVNDEWRLYGSGAFNDIEDKTTGERIRSQGIARQKFTVGVQYNNKHHGFAAHLLGAYNRWSSPLSVAPIDDRKPIFDLKLIKNFSDYIDLVDMEVFFNIHNLTNSSYSSSSAFPLPERYFEGGITIKF